MSFYCWDFAIACAVVALVLRIHLCSVAGLISNIPPIFWRAPDFVAPSSATASQYKPNARSQVS